MNDILTVAEVKALEKQIEEEGTSLFDLMERAGGCVSEYVMKRFENTSSVVIFCGSGNNGGDGWVIASDLVSAGFPVTLVSSLKAEQLSVEPARSAALKTTAQKHPLLSIMVAPTQEQLSPLLQNAHVVIDACLGIGFSGKTLREPYCSWVSALNEARQAERAPHVVAVDVPSGLDADTGRAANPCVIADATITMLAYKPGLMLDASKQYCGELSLARIHP